MRGTSRGSVGPRVLRELGEQAAQLGHVGVVEPGAQPAVEPPKRDSCSSPLRSMFLTNARSCRWPLLRSLIPWSAFAIRRRRMIWLIGATPFGHASMQLKQCVQS